MGRKRRFSGILNWSFAGATVCPIGEWGLMIARESLNLQTPYELPAGKLEELIAGIFAEVFELDRVGAADEWRGVTPAAILTGQRLARRSDPG